MNATQYRLSPIKGTTDVSLEMLDEDGVWVRIEAGDRDDMQATIDAYTKAQ